MAGEVNMIVNKLTMLLKHYFFLSKNLLNQRFMLLIKLRRVASMLINQLLLGRNTIPNFLLRLRHRLLNLRVSLLLAEFTHFFDFGGCAHFGWSGGCGRLST